MADYRHFYDEFGDHVLAAGFMVAEMARRAEVGAEFARGIAPVETGEFKESIKAGADVRPSSGRYKRRARGYVESDDEKAPWIEFGTHGRQGARVLGRALDAMRSA